MIFNCYKPHPALACFIKQYSFLESRKEHYFIKPLPDGFSIEIGIVEGDSILAKYKDKGNVAPMPNFIGGINHNIEYINSTGTGKYIGIFLQPYALRYLFHEEPAVFVKHINFFDFFKFKGKLLAEQIHESGSQTNKVEILNNFFLCLLKKGKQIDSKSNYLFGMNFRLSKITQVNEFCKQLNTTPRTMQRFFKDVIGISPKDFLSVCRINSLVNELKRASHFDLFDIIERYNYCDQSHLISDLKKHTGFSAKELFNKVQNKFIPYSRNLIVE